MICAGEDESLGRHRGKGGRHHADANAKILIGSQYNTILSLGGRQTKQHEIRDDELLQVNPSHDALSNALAVVSIPSPDGDLYSKLRSM